MDVADRISRSIPAAMMNRSLMTTFRFAQTWHNRPIASANGASGSSLMADKPPKPDTGDTEAEADIQRRFQETLGRLVNTPHKPHKPLGNEKAPPKRG